MGMTRTSGKTGFNLSTFKRDRMNPKKSKALHALIQMMESTGMNPWDARMKARELLQMKVPATKFYDYD